jgi:hypothetical protein
LKPRAPSILVLCLALALHCAPAPKSPHSFDEIQRLVAGKTAREVEAILGKPDAREHLLTDNERWTWWNYTSLAGEQYAPEIRGQIVHLEIVFESPTGSGFSLPISEWRVLGPFAVSYSRLARGD